MSLSKSALLRRVRAINQLAQEMLSETRFLESGIKKMDDFDKEDSNDVFKKNWNKSTVRKCDTSPLGRSMDSSTNKQNMHAEEGQRFQTILPDSVSKKESREEALDRFY
jgi:hypothetical protein